MVNPGAHYRCPEAWGRLFALWQSNGTYNTVDTNVGAYNTVLCQDGCGVLFPQAYRVWPLVSWFDLCAAFFFRTWSFTSGHPRLDGSNRPWPRQSEKSGKQTFYGVPGRRRGVGVGSSVLGQAFRSERPPGGGWCPRHALWSKVGQRG